MQHPVAAWPGPHSPAGPSAAPAPQSPAPLRYEHNNSDNSRASSNVSCRSFPRRSCSERSPILAVTTRGFQPVKLQQQQIEEHPRRQKLVYVPTSRGQHTFSRLSPSKSASFPGHQPMHDASQKPSPRTTPTRMSPGFQTIQASHPSSPPSPAWQAALAPQRTTEALTPTRRSPPVMCTVTPTKVTAPVMPPPDDDAPVSPTGPLLGGTTMQMLHQATLAPLEPKHAFSTARHQLQHTPAQYMPWRHVAAPASSARRQLCWRRLSWAAWRSSRMRAPQ